MTTKQDPKHPWNDKGARAGRAFARRHRNIVSPFEQRAKGRSWTDDAVVDPALVVRAEDIAKFDRMCQVPCFNPHDLNSDRDGAARRLGMKPLKPPAYRFTASPAASPAAVAARKDRNGVA